MKRTPAAVFPPGVTIEEEMAERNWGREHLAQQLFVSEAFLDLLLVGDERISAQLAERLAVVFSVSATFWVQLDLTWRHRPRRKD